MGQRSTATLNRRGLFTAAAAAAVASTRGAGAAAPPRRPAPVRMKLGCQSGPTSDERLGFFARMGVTHVCGILPREDRGPYTVEALEKLRDRCARQRITLSMIALPFLHSSHVDRTDRPAIMLAQSPQRDRDIEEIQTIIRNCAKAGISAIKYNLTLIGVVRTKRTTGRGGWSLSTWRLAEAGDLAKKVTRAGRVPADEYWERIDYFLRRVVPVAAEHKVRIACHPQDPGVPPGFMGVDAVLGTVDGLKRFVGLHDSPYHGLNFCQGTVSEMLADPGREILDVIRWFGERKKIFNVHFRNIRGRRDSFQEVLPDDGDVDFVKAIRAYRDVGYDGMLMPDHVPEHPDDPDEKQAFAFSYGYIRALIQAADALA